MELPFEQRCSHGSKKLSYNIETKNLSFKLCSQFDRFKREYLGGDDSTRGSKFILKNVNCEARAGGITAIAGPSGAGKTTLLEILGGRISPCGYLGEVLVNNRPLDSASFRRKSGYVAQEDALFPLLTVKETLNYSAMLRIPGGRSVAAARVTELMKVLCLEQVADSRIGKISGGERRRVSIGVDLVHDPAVVFIDEPTSGLDSTSALNVVLLLRRLAGNQGKSKTIVMTIHQPGFRILELIDQFVLLSNGYVIHNGPLSLLKEKLTFAGNHIPDHANVLEFSIDMIGSLYIQNAETISMGYKSTHEEEEEEELHNLEEIRISNSTSSSESEENVVLYPNSRIKETAILGQRFCRNIFRTKQLFATRVIQALVAGFVLGTIFLNVGKQKGKLALQTRTGFFAFSLTFLLSSTTEGLPIFLQERRILMSETSKGAYRISSYVLANTFVFLPFLLMVGLLYSIPVYWLVGLRSTIDGFLFYSLVVWMVVLTSNSLVSCFSALVPNFIMGTSVIAGLMGSFFLFSGYFISKEDIPKYWIFMHYISLFKYPFECFMINEYGGERGGRNCIQMENGECSMNGAQFLKQRGLKESQKWTNLLVMLSFIVGYRVLCLIILCCRSYRTRN